MAWRRSAGLLDAPPVVVQPGVSTVAAASEAPVTMKLRLFMLLWRMEDTVRAFLGGDRSASAATRRKCWRGHGGGVVFWLQMPAQTILKDFGVQFLKNS